MQTVMTPDSGTVDVTRTTFGYDLNVMNPTGETIATVVLRRTEAWELFRALGVLITEDMEQSR